MRGIPETKRALERIDLELKAAAPEASHAGGTVLGRAMVASAPKRTGRLAASIRLTMSGDTAKVGSDLPYARFVQFGTRYMSAQPFENEAADSTTSSIIAAIAAVMKSAIH